MGVYRYCILPKDEPVVGRRQSWEFGDRGYVRGCQCPLCQKPLRETSEPKSAFQRIANVILASRQVCFVPGADEVAERDYIGAWPSRST